MDFTKLYDIRKSKKMSQTAVAVAVGVSVKTYQLWETGAGKPNETNLEKLKKVLDLK